MRICMVGWHYNKDYIKLMEKISEFHPVHIVAHREGYRGNLPVTLIDNIGLEFHCYNHYISKLWDGESDVLFCHDDIEMNPVVVNFEIIPSINIFNKIAKLEIDQGYVFQNESDATWNNGKHGRMIFMSAILIKYLKDNGGIWFDSTNRGYTTIGPYNDGINKFHETMEKLRDNFDTCNLIFCPAITQLRRNGEVGQSITAVVNGGVA